MFKVLVTAAAILFIAYVLYIAYNMGVEAVSKKKKRK